MGIRAGFRYQCRKTCRFDADLRHQTNADLAQPVEHFLGMEEVVSSRLTISPNEILSGIGAAWLARVSGGHEAASSNLAYPTNFLKTLQSTLVWP